MRKILMVSSLMLLLSLQCAAFSAPKRTGPRELSKVLAKARAQAKGWNYDAAIELYDSVSAECYARPGLLIEWGRVYASAGKHDEAIERFEKLRGLYPEKSDRILIELGDQYKVSGKLQKAVDVYGIVLDADPANKHIRLSRAEVLSWQGDHDFAVAEYDIFLAQHPSDRSVLLAKAQVLSWADRLEQAEPIYRKVLEDDPQNLKAKAGLARIEVWKGYNRLGQKMYQEILVSEPNNLEVLNGLAKTQFWDGRGDLASGTIQKILEIDPENKDALGTSKQIAGSRSLYASQFNSNSSDKNGLRVSYTGFMIGGRIDDLTSVSLIWPRQKSEDSTVISGNKYGFSLIKRLSETVEIDTYMYTSDYDFIGFRPFTTNTWVTIKPDDVWRFKISANREIFEDAGSLINKIIVDGGSFTLDYEPDRFQLFSVSYKKGWYSDGNEQDSVFAKAEYGISTLPVVRVYYNIYNSKWGRQLDSGYFNPLSIMSQSLGIYTNYALNDSLSGDARVSYGYENQAPVSDTPTYYYSASLDYLITHNFKVQLKGEHFNASSAQSAGGYARTSTTVGFTYNFAQAPREIENAQSYSRVIIR